MGGGDSKQQDIQGQDLPERQLQALKNDKAKKGSNAISPKNQNNKSPLGYYNNNLKQGAEIIVDKYVNQGKIKLINKIPNNNNQDGYSQNSQQGMTYDNIKMSQSLIQQQYSQTFENWDPIFHSNGILNLNLSIWNLQSTYQCKNINKQYSQHQGSLSWQYQQLKLNNKKINCLRFILEEDDGYMVTFLVDNSNRCLEGDQQLWKVICPFRTIEETSRVGSYVCQRFYHSNKNNYDDEEEEDILNAQLFYKWDQKAPINRFVMKKLIKKRRILQQLKNLDGFQYCQVTKYYTDKDQWKFMVMIEEKNNCFKSWLVCLTQKQKPKYNNKEHNSEDFDLTLKNDINNRENMYIQEIKKKKNILKVQKIKQK